VNIQLQKDEIILEHHADADVIIIVKKGKVTFKVEGETVQLTAENMLHMKPMEKHSLKADVASDIIVMQIKP
jgi:quercetin dioxygenase-like cupin family protein